MDVRAQWGEDPEAENFFEQQASGLHENAQDVGDWGDGMMSLGIPMLNSTFYSQP